MARTVVLTFEAVERFEKAVSEWWMRREKRGFPPATEIAIELECEDRVVQKLLKRKPNERTLLIYIFQRYIKLQATAKLPTIDLWELTEQDFGLKPKDEQARQLITEGFHLYHGADYLSATGKFEEALELLKRTERPDLLASAYVRLGEVALAVGEDNEALQRIQYALTLYPVKSLPQISADAYSILGTLYLRADDLEESREAYKKSIEHCKRTGHIHGVAWAEMGILSVEIESENIEQANVHLERAHALIHSIKNPSLNAALALREARLRIREGNLEMATSLADRAFEFWQTVDHPRWLALVWLSRAEIAQARKNKEESRQFALESLRLYESVGDRYGIDRVKRLISS